MLDQDYQWPSSSLNYFKNNNDFSSESVEKLINKIEDFFSQQYDCYVCLMPSGRSSISIILRYLNFTRSKTVFIPKWSSNCLYSSIGPYSNVSTDLIDPDLILVNHKWGYGYQLHQDYSKKIIIEDSVDTIHLDNSSLFQNNGIAEIISLPKIIGSFSGGLILTRDKKLSDYIHSVQQSNLELGISQSKKKRLDGKSKNDWDYHEHLNTSLDLTGLVNIVNHMKNLFININIITNRRRAILEKFIDIKIDSKRLGPVIVFPKSKYKILGSEDNFMLRQFNYSLQIEDAYSYQSSYLLPVHFGLLDKQFESLLDAIDER